MRLASKTFVLALICVCCVLLIASDSSVTGRTRLHGEISKIYSDEFVTGAESAPVTLIAYVNFQCVYCQSFHTEILPRLKSEFIESGKLKVVYRVLPMNANIASDAVVTAETAECAAHQQKFWEMTDVLYHHQDENVWQNFQKWSMAANIPDKNRFNGCFAFHETASRVLKNQHRYAIHDVKMTPTIIIGDSKTEGLLDYMDYKALILEQLD